MTDAAADAVAQDVLLHRARREPSWATQVGLGGYDDAVKDASPEGVHARYQDLEVLIPRAESLPPSIERDALLHVLLLERFEITDVRTHARNPDLAVEYFDHLFHLLVAVHVPPQDRLRHMAARLDAAPRYFAEGRRRFDPAEVPRLWVEGALRSADGGPAFFDALREYAASVGRRGALDGPILRAEAALLEHREWLQGLHADARGSVAVGRDTFVQLLRLRGIRESPEDLMDLGHAVTQRFRHETREAALTVLAEAGREPGDDPAAEALEIVRADHPAHFQDVIRFHVEAIREAREFVRARGLATLTDVPLDVVETPAFLRHLVPFAAYLSPARFATPRRGVYLVTPKVDLRAFPRPDVRNTTVHEAYPGHHLHLARSAEHATLAAFLSDAPDLVEGWALYCEAMMGEHGHDATPAARFVRARDALWRAVRITLDAGIHAFSMSPEEASAVLSRETGMSQEEADAEILRYTQTPGYNLSYMWGRLRIEKLRDAWISRGRDLPSFHDAVLQSGGIPVSLLEAALLR